MTKIIKIESCKECELTARRKAAINCPWIVKWEIPRKKDLITIHKDCPLENHNKDCITNIFSSRTCERGTKSCTVYHDDCDGCKNKPKTKDDAYPWDCAECKRFYGDHFETSN